MCQNGQRGLTFETLLTDPLVRLMMEADGVTPQDLVTPLLVARDAVAARELAALSVVLGSLAAMSGRA